jgi:hypothetical protein
MIMTLSARTQVTAVLLALVLGVGCGYLPLGFSRS